MKVFYEITRSNEVFKTIYKMAEKKFGHKAVSLSTVRRWLCEIRSETKYVSYWRYIDLLVQYF